MGNSVGKERKEKFENEDYEIEKRQIEKENEKYKIKQQKYNKEREELRLHKDKFDLNFTNYFIEIENNFNKLNEKYLLKIFIGKDYRYQLANTYVIQNFRNININDLICNRSVCFSIYKKLENKLDHNYYLNNVLLKKFNCIIDDEDEIENSCLKLFKKSCQFVKDFEDVNYISRVFKWELIEKVD